MDISLIPSKFHLTLHHNPTESTDEDNTNLYPLPINVYEYNILYFYINPLCLTDKQRVTILNYEAYWKNKLQYKLNYLPKINNMNIFIPKNVEIIVDSYNFNTNTLLLPELLEYNYKCSENISNYLLHAYDLYINKAYIQAISEYALIEKKWKEEILESPEETRNVQLAELYMCIWTAIGTIESTIGNDTASLFAFHKAHSKYLLHFRKSQVSAAAAMNSIESDESDFELDTNQLNTEKFKKLEEKRAYKFKGLDLANLYWGADLLHPALAPSFGNLGMACYRLGWHEIALCCYYQSYQIRNSLSVKEDKTLEVGSIVNNLGVCYQSLSNYSYALGCFETSVKLISEKLPRSSPRMDVVNHNLDKIKQKTLLLTIENNGKMKQWQVISNDENKNSQSQAVASQDKPKKKK